MSSDVPGPVGSGVTPIRAAALRWAAALWRPVSLGALFCLLFLEQIVYLVRIVWQEEKYSHGFLIPVVSLGWLWLNRERLAAQSRSPSHVGIVVVAVGILLWLMTRVTGFNALAHLAMLVVLSGMVVFATGWRYFARVLFPVGYLVFCFPVPRRLDDIYVVLPLQRFASAVSERVIDFFGIPVVRTGNVIEVPGIELMVEEACSGLHSLYSLIALSAAFVFLTEWRRWERVAIIALSVPIAILANVFRVSLTGVLAYTVTVEAATGFFH